MISIKLFFLLLAPLFVGAIYDFFLLVALILKYLLQEFASRSTGWLKNPSPVNRALIFFLWEPAGKPAG
jgi:hypothetical protein